MGMAGGAYKGDRDRAQLALQARAQAARENAENRRLAIMENEQRMRQEAQAAALKAQQEGPLHGKAGRKWLGGGDQGEAPAESQSPYSVSAFDLDAAARQRANDQRLMALERQNNTLGQFQQVVNMERQQAAAKKAQGQATVASLMKMAKLNGGVAPIAALELATRQMGFDGKTSAIGGAGFASNGDFVLDFIQKDPQTGQMSRATNLIGRADQGRIYYGQQGIFDNADRAAWRQDMLKSRYSTDEINQYAGLNATAIQGLDEAGRKRLADGFVDPTRDVTWDQELQQRKRQLQIAQIDEAIAKVRGKPTTAQARQWIAQKASDLMKMKVQKNVTDEVGNVSKVTVQKYENPKDVWADAISMYDDFLEKTQKYSDPALNGGSQGGQQPAPGTEANPLAPGSEAKPPAAPAAGGEAVPAQTATPSPSATATPPAEGQGELDFGGEEPEAGNLTHEGRKWKLYTDDNGKVSGYGTTRSMVTKTDDGRFAVIPTIVNGEEMSDADAVDHFKKTGEHWGIVKTEDEAKKLAEQVHLDGQEHERAAWNEYIQDHWDEMSDEIRNDPGVAEERKRRQAAKSKSNSWKNSALFK